MFASELPEHDGWVITRLDNQLTVYSLTPRRVQQFTFEKPAYETEVTWTILQLVEHWVNISPEHQYWRHIRLYVQNGWEYRHLDTMNSRDPEAQQHLRNLALAQTRRRHMISMSRVLDRASETIPCDVHQVPDLTIYYCLQTRWNGSWSQYQDLNERRSTADPCEPMKSDSDTGKTFATNSGSQFGSTPSHKRDRQELLYCLLDYVPSKDTTAVSKETSTKRLMAKWRRSHSPIKACEMHASITRLRNLSSLPAALSAPTVVWKGNNAPMLLEMHRQLQNRRDRVYGRELDMLWGSIEIGFFFLDRSSEHWGPPTTNDHERDVSHCVKAADVIFRNKYGFITEPGPEKFPQWKSSTGHIKEIKRDRAARSATFDLVYQMYGLWRLQNYVY